MISKIDTYNVKIINNDIYIMYDQDKFSITSHTGIDVYTGLI